MKPEKSEGLDVFDAPAIINIRDVTDMIGSVLLLDKPSGCTSYDCIRRLKRYFPKSTKIGHAGTLDPLATGLLILLFGKATKSQQRFMNLTKRYEATMRLGETTSSMDSETEVIEHKAISGITPDQIQAAIEKKIGVIDQIPPMYSAIKVKGERLYKKARRGEVIQRKPNRVTLYSIELLDINGADVRFSVKCSKGTYIRVLAHDLGQSLGVGGHLIQLRRTAIGNYHVQRASTLDTLTNFFERS
ncbi:MAG: tRNA pseudouridine(55) synthase TruB [Bacteroidetes bacterium]|nr:tRNA pseudouridine(55) synthase TruB [Bacteroidota bacterium]